MATIGFRFFPLVKMLKPAKHS